MRKAGRMVIMLLFAMGSLLGGACGAQEERNMSPTAAPTNEVSESEEWTELPEKELTYQRYNLSGGRKLENLVKVGEDELYYCNRPENITGGSTTNPVLLCVDPVYDITYYVNYGRDFMIYAERNGVSELAVEIPASNLFCREGELYFIAENYGSFELDGMDQGNILKYNPVDGTVEIVVAEKATAMRVYPDAINFGLEMPLPAGGKLEYVNTYSFMTETVNKNPGIDEMDRWKEYGFQLEKEKFQGEVPEELKPNLPFMYSTLGCKYVNRLGETVGDLPNYTSLPENHLPNLFKIHEDKAYYIEWWNMDNSEMICYDLGNGELESVIKAELPSGITNEFILYGDKIIFGNLMCYSLQDENLTCFFYTNQERNYSVNFFYIDGNCLYGVVNGQLYRMEEVVLSEEKMQGRVSGTSYNDVYVPSGNVAYELIDPTEEIREDGV